MSTSCYMKHCRLFRMFLMEDKWCIVRNYNRCCGSGAGKLIKIKFHSAVPSDTRKEYLDLLAECYRIEQSEDYDYFLAMETIYKSNANMKEFLQSKEDAIRIMICGEAVYPDLNLFDYATWYWGGYQSYDRIIDVPYLCTLEGTMMNKLSDFDVSYTEADVEKIFLQKQRFCNFIYSNPNAYKMRDLIFSEISKYKRIDSLGKHLNNTRCDRKRSSADWARESVEMKRPYKFSISVENTLMLGYTTEKIVSSMLADSIAIYYGNPNVGQQFNSKAFINAHDFNTIEELVDRVCEIDNDKNLYCDMLMQSRRTVDQVKECLERYRRFKLNFLNIFASEKKEARRRPHGTWSEYIYPSFLLNESNMSVHSLINYAMKKLHFIQ